MKLLNQGERSLAVKRVGCGLLEKGEKINY